MGWDLSNFGRLLKMRRAVNDQHKLVQKYANSSGRRGKKDEPWPGGAQYPLKKTSGLWP